MTATVSYTPIRGHRPSSPPLRMSSALTTVLGLPCSLTAVLDPRTTPVSAGWLMAAASTPLRTSATGLLMAEAARLRTVSESDRAVQAVWDAEGGHEDRASITRRRIPAVTAPITGVPAVARAIPDAARGM
ncbi:hypothetical protein AB5J56_30540 [Streptomyces sp. R21]|uniref:Uncharacterized protein n=1 Tax=Streptomyces sp. R21 TaxID=3238627 RepID=A0AB39PIA5_9ACTN